MADIDVEKFKAAINYDRYYAKHGGIIKISSSDNLGEVDFYRTVVFADGYYRTFYRGTHPSARNNWARTHRPNDFKFQGHLEQLSIGQLSQLKKNGIID